MITVMIFYLQKLYLIMTLLMGYKILEISSNAGVEEIKENFRRLAKKYHPDISKEKNAENKFREITEAYEILSNPKSKLSWRKL